MNSGRRQFIRNIAIIGIGLSIDPFKLLASNGITIDKEVEEIIEDLTVEMTPPLRQLNNYCISSTLTESELKAQYIGIVNMLAVSTETNFNQMPDQEKYKVLKDAQAKQEINKQQIKDLYKASIVTGTVALGVMTIMRGKLAIMLGASGTILKLPKWVERTGKIVDGAATMYAGGSLIKDTLTNKVIYSAEVSQSSIYRQFLNTNSEEFRLKIPDFKLDISSDSKQLNDVLNGNSIPDEVTSRFVNWIKKELEGKDIFRNKKDLKVFLDKYVEKVGDVQQTILQKMFDAERKKDEEEQLRQRDTAALCQSIQGAIGLAISHIAAPREAEILNTLIGAGFQAAMVGMGPMGWTAIGINIATSLFSKSSNHEFEKAIMKALQQIQKQLNIIIEQIEIIQKNQIDILVQLNDILLKMDNLEDIIVVGFQNLNDKIDIIYNRLLTEGRENLENDFLSADAGLSDAYNNNNWEEFYRGVQKLRDIANNRVNDNYLTKYEDGSLKAEILKKQVLFEQKYKLGISLYDSIGLSSAFYHYNPAYDRGMTDFKPVHPIEFNILVKTIIGWLIVSELGSANKIGIAKNLLSVAVETNINFKRIAERKTVEDKAAQYEKIATTLLSSLHTHMSEIENDLTSNKTNLLRKFDLRTSEKIRLDDFIDESIKNINSATNFLDNHNDHQLYNLAIDLKLFGKIETVSKMDPQTRRKTEERFKDKMPRRPDDHFSNFCINDINAYKDNKIVFSNVLLDYSSNIYVTFDVFYSVKMHIRNYRDVASNSKPCGHEGNSDCFNILRTITDTDVKYVYNDTWKKSVIEQCEEKGHSINNFISDFETISFNDFLKHLIGQGFWLLKYDLIDKTGKYVQGVNFTNYDGSGLALMVLSKLNNLMTSENPTPYVIDYSDELFIREDIISLLQGILQTNFDKEGKEKFQQLLNASLTIGNDKEKSPYYLKKAVGYTNKLDTENFVDLCAIILKEKIMSTVQSSVDKTSVLQDFHSEPFIQDSINSLKWYLETQV